VQNVAAPITSPQQLSPMMAEPKPFSWAKPAHFDFSSSASTVQDDVLSTAGDARTSAMGPGWTATLNRHPQPHRPLDAHYNSVMDEPQLS
jgi:hypothetical protein